jgi:hypothetical protein
MRDLELGISARRGVFLEIDLYQGEVRDPESLNKYIYAENDPISNIDPSGASAITNALFGTAVHSFLARAFEGFTPVAGGVGGNPGPRTAAGPGVSFPFKRWGNRQIRSIAFGITGAAVPAVSPLTFRPDFVEYNSGTRTGNLYELKSASLAELLNPAFAAIAAAQLWVYRGLLTLFVPQVGWSFGRTWAPA